MGTPEWDFARPVALCGPMRVWSETLELRSTSATELLDLTEMLRGALSRSGIRHGIVNVQTRHTTTGLLVNENEPLLAEDFCRLFERWAPQHAPYRHDDMGQRAAIEADERANGHAHARALILGASVTLNVVEGRMQLGTWQRVFLVELDGARSRSVSVLALGVDEGKEQGPGPRRRLARRVLAGSLALLALCSTACRSTPPPPPHVASLRWTTYANSIVGYSLEVPDVYEPSSHHDGNDVIFRYDRFPVLVVRYVDEEEGRRRGLWPGHPPTAIEVAGREGSRYSYDHGDGPFFVHTVSYVLPWRGKLLGLEFRSESEEPDAIRRQILESLRLEGDVSQTPSSGTGTD